MIRYFIDNIKKHNISSKLGLFNNFAEYDKCLMANIPIIFNNVQTTDIFIKNGIEAKKYYFPLGKSHKVANDIYDRIVCLPLNIDIDKNVIDKYVEICLILCN
jgi:dTDP-4-amino-4,6-dideoxygalactose transaminase